MGLFDWLLGRRGASKASAPVVPRPDPPVRSIPSTPTRTSGPGTTTARPAPPTGRWVRAGETIDVAGFRLPGGMVYVGSGLRAPNGMVEPALIDPALPVSSRAPGAPTPYWPSYGGISPEHRGRFLAWLASGRTGEVEPGYPFLFFYGLERRVFVDLAHASPEVLATELTPIREEVARLLEVYGASQGSLRRYGAELLQVIALLRAERRPIAGSYPRSGPRYPVPMALRAELGRLAQASRPVPADLALAWGWFHEEVPFRTPATRCADPFARLFRIRYRERHGEGIVLKPGKTRLGFAYTSASAGLGTIRIATEDLPDVFAQKAPVRRITAMIDAVTEELDAYSRWLGRNPDRADSLAAVALLPAPLAREAGGALDGLRTWVERHLTDDGPVVAPGADLLAVWSDGAERLGKADAVALAQVLEHLGVGIEPDIRFGGASPTSVQPVVLFRLHVAPFHTATPAYGMATTLVHLAAAVGAADGDLSRPELDVLGAHIASTLHLTAAERDRLNAHLRWMTVIEVRLTGLNGRLAALRPKERRTIGDVLIAVASSDDVVSVAEIRTLRRIFTLLGLDPAEVSTRLQPTPPVADGPVTVRPARAGEAGIAIPPRPEASPQARAALVLDHDRLIEVMGQTAEVSALLADIYAEDEDRVWPRSRTDPEPVPPGIDTPDVADATPTIATLDAPHSRLLRDLGARDAWPWAEVEGLAARHALMPNGAIDTINEAALDAVDLPVIDGEDPVTIDRATLEDLLR